MSLYPSSLQIQEAEACRKFVVKKDFYLNVNQRLRKFRIGFSAEKFRNKFGISTRIQTFPICLLILGKVRFLAMFLFF